ncbi:PREDICTED: dentin sialophosphoprotein-like [Branchiostoma belcheri]|uniref:Dentin sialophosphoprotein-like n=1 Tax=Branchiostoma belcheri TaxID=7741 RepID=A0A6P4Z183_BRABE|nr:PREDICTED: dentin sialophosphoprotein-like [Branchiostoma belcheri]
MAHSSLLGLVVFLTWSGAGHTASYPNLECCCSTKMDTYEGNFTDDTTILICFKASFHSIQKPLPPSLKRYEIWNQNIPNMTQGDFPSLESLESLSVRESQVVTIQPGSFQTLPNLSQLSITGNKIARLEAETFRGLTKLEFLNMNYNRLHYIDDAAFAGLTGLRKLSLSRNCLSSIPRGTDQSPWPLVLDMTWNPLTSLIAADELKHVSRLVLAKNGLPCDCKLRDMKRWMTRNKQWSITCDPGPYKRLGWLSLDDLKCDYKVSVSSDYGTVTGNVSLTCQTDCHEGLDLTFSWIAPNGDRLSSTREYSRIYTDARESDCKETPVTRRETKKTCYSVLHIPTLRRGMEDETSTRTYANMYASQSQTTARDATTPVVGKGTTRPDRGLSPMQLVLVGLAPFAGCSVIVMVIVVCVSKCKGDRQRDNANGHRRRYYGNDDQISGTDAEARGVSYENDDQFSDTDGENGVHYENDDQFSDTDGGKRNEYENDNQFSDTDCTHGGQYENDDQFSDDDDVASKHPRRTVPLKLHGRKPGKTPSIANAKRTRPSRHQKKSLGKRKTTRSRRKVKSNVLRVIADVHAQAQASGQYDNDKKATGLCHTATSSRPKVKSNVLRVIADVHAQAQGSGQYDNDKKATGLCHTAPATSSRPKAKSNVLRVLAEVHAQAQASGHYDNDTNATGINNSKATTSSDNVASDDGQYDNERPVTDSVTTPASEATKRSNDGSDSDQDYMTLPSHSPGEDTGNGENAQSEGKADDRNMTSTSACADDVSSDNDYITFPGEEDADGKTRKKKGRDLSNAEDSSEHTYVTFPGEENDEKRQRENDEEHKRVAERQIDQASDSDDISDHVYVTFPETENVKEEKTETRAQEGHLPDSETDSSNAENSSDHTYVTFPGEENDEERQSEAEKKSEHTRDTDSSNSGDDSDHTYVTFPSEENDDYERETECQNGQASGLDSGDISDHIYVTFPETENVKTKTRAQEGHVSDLDTPSSNVEDSSEHTYVMFPLEENNEKYEREADKKEERVPDDLDTDSSNTEDNSDHTYVTFPDEESRHRSREDLGTALPYEENSLEHTYVMFPGDENAAEKTRKKDGRVLDLDTALSNIEDSSDHTYVMFPSEESGENKRKTEHQNGLASDLDLDSVVTNSDDVLDHFYVTFPETENPKEDENETKLEEGHLSDSETDSSNTEEDSSDHFYVTFPGHGEENDEKQQRPSGKMGEPVSDLNTASSNTEDNSGHAYVTSSGEENDEETAKRDSILGWEDGRTCVRLTQLYLTQR